MIKKIKYWLLCKLLPDQSLLRQIYFDDLCNLADKDPLKLFEKYKLTAFQIYNLFNTPVEVVKGDAIYNFKVEINE